MRFSINIWWGIIHNTLLGPHVKTNRLTGANYRDFLVNTLPVLLEEVPLVVCARTCFQHDGAPAHFSHLDLNPLYFFLWRHLKTLVCATPVDNVVDLLPRIVDGCNTIRTTPGLLERVRQSMLLRCQLCLQEGGVTSKIFCNAEIAKVIVCFGLVSYCLFVQNGVAS